MKYRHFPQWTHSDFCIEKPVWKARDLWLMSWCHKKVQIFPNSYPESALELQMLKYVQMIISACAIWNFYSQCDRLFDKDKAEVSVVESRNFHPYLLIHSECRPERNSSVKTPLHVGQPTTASTAAWDLESVKLWSIHYWTETYILQKHSIPPGYIIPFIRRWRLLPSWTTKFIVPQNGCVPEGLRVGNMFMSALFKIWAKFKPESWHLDVAFLSWEVINNEMTIKRKTDKLAIRIFNSEHWALITTVQTEVPVDTLGKTGVEFTHKQCRG
jgi:hypothetical protein